MSLRILVVLALLGGLVTYYTSISTTNLIMELADIVDSVQRNTGPILYTATTAIKSLFHSMTDTLEFGRELVFSSIATFVQLHDTMNEHLDPTTARTVNVAIWLCFATIIITTISQIGQGVYLCWTLATLLFRATLYVLVLVVNVQRYFYRQCLWLTATLRRRHHH